MKRPILIATIGYLIGIIIGLYLPIGMILFFCIFLYTIMKEKNRTKKKIVLTFCIGLIIAGMYTWYLNKEYQTQYKELKNKEELHIIGTVISDIEEKEYKETYQIKIEAIENQKQKKSMTMIASVKKENGKKIKVQYGDQVEITGVYEEPSIERNYRGFDYKQYLQTKEIIGTITTTIQKVKVIRPNHINVIDNMINKLTKQIKNKLAQFLPEQQAGLCMGILLGDKTQTEEKIIEDFKESNLSHMLAVSGAHVSYIVVAAEALFSKLGKQKANVIVMILLLIFMKMTNMTPSVMRACIMCITAIIAKIFYKKADIATTISISILVIVIRNPFSIFDVGMQLSYAGVIGIIMFYEIIQNKRSKGESKDFKIKKKIVQYIKDTIVVTLSANILIMPIMIYQFYTVSLTFVISNLLASPILGAIVILGFASFLGSWIGLGGILAYILNFFLVIIIKISEFCSNLPFSQIYVISPHLFTIILFYIILLFGWYIKNHKQQKEKIMKKYQQNKKVIKSILVLTIIVSLIFVFATRSFHIYFIDVGQGDSTLVITRDGKTILIDGGGSREMESFDVGKQVLLPYLLSRKVNHIDYMMVSHFDADHCRAD